VVVQSAHDNEYEQKRNTLAALRHSMLAERVTYSVVQARLREAAIEQAEAQAAYLEERLQALEPLVTTATRRVAELTADVEQLRVNAVAQALEQTVTALTTAVRTLDTQIRELCAELPTALALAERAQQYANSLPAGHLRERIATNETAERLRAMDDLVHLLCYLLGERELPGR
jgi:chromosome segregation ATPase